MSQPTEPPIVPSEERKRTEVRVAVVGNVDSGKTTLVGVLSKGTMDDGRGLARGYVFNYQHEQENGRTSSIAHEIMGFNEAGEQVLPTRLTELKKTMWERIVSESSHVVTFIDLCGHEKYLKTTMLGLSGLSPDYALIIVGANSGLTVMTREHLGLSMALKIPIIIVISKIDLERENMYQKTLEMLQKILRSPGAGSKVPVVVRDEDDLSPVIAGMEINVVPICPLSSVTGQGVNKLRELLKRLPPRCLQAGLYGSVTDPTELQIDSVYSVTGIGMVAAGVLKAGRVTMNQLLLLGPDSTGEFKPVNVKGIHFNRKEVEEGLPGQSICVALKSQKRGEQLKRDSFRKGMMLLDRSIRPKAVWEFDAEVVILHHSTTIRVGYEAVMHIGIIRQAARILTMSRDTLATRDKGLVRFRFLYSPEFIRPGATLLFREGKTKGLGNVTSVCTSDEPATSTSTQ